MISDQLEAYGRASRHQSLCTSVCAGFTRKLEHPLGFVARFKGGRFSDWLTSLHWLILEGVLTGQVRALGCVSNPGRWKVVSYRTIRVCGLISVLC